MINLLPDSEKKALHKEYRNRVIVVILVWTLVTSFLAFILLVPSYFLILYKEGIVKTSLKQENQKNTATADASSKLQSAKIASAMLKPTTINFLPTQIIALIIKDKTENNSITNIVYNKKSDSPLVVTVRGVAKTRQGIVDFTKALSSEPSILPIDLPISSFAKDTNIDFSFDVQTK